MCQFSSRGAGSNCELRKANDKNKESEKNDFGVVNTTEEQVELDSQFDMVMDCFLIDVINVIINLHYGGLVATSVAIVRGRENSHNCSIVLPLISLHNKLMSPGNEMKIVDVGELFCDILPKRIPRSSWRDPPTTSLMGSKRKTSQFSMKRDSRLYTTDHHLPIIRIRPHQITHGPFVGNFLHAIQVPSMIKSIDGGRESTVETKNAIRDHSCHWEVIEGVREVLPNIGVSVFSQAFVVKPVTSGRDVNSHSQQ